MVNGGMALSLLVYPKHRKCYWSLTVSQLLPQSWFNTRTYLRIHLLLNRVNRPTTNTNLRIPTDHHLRCPARFRKVFSFGWLIFTWTPFRRFFFFIWCCLIYKWIEKRNLRFLQFGVQVILFHPLSVWVCG